MKLIKELLEQDSSSSSKETQSSKSKKVSKRKLIKKKLKLDVINAKEFVPKMPSFKNVPKLKIKKAKTKASELNLSSNTNTEEKCKEKANKALSKLSPGKKALLQSIFMSKKKTTIKDLAKELEESEDKLEELKANALRNLIYGK